MSRSVGRPLEKQIRSAFVLELMKASQCSTLGELALKTGINRNTLDNWAYEDRSPVRSLEIARGLLLAVGQNEAANEVEKMIAMCDWPFVRRSV